MVAVLGGFEVSSTQADIVTIDLGTTNYQLSYDNDKAKVTVQDISYPAKGGNFDVITEKVTLLTNDPFTLMFAEKKDPGTTSATSGGPKFSIHEVITNGTDKNWTGFNETIKDLNFPNITTITLADGTTRGSMMHPVFAHFHPGNQADGVQPKDFMIANNVFKDVAPDLRKDGDGVPSFTLSNGEIPNDKRLRSTSPAFSSTRSTSMASSESLISLKPRWSLQAPSQQA
jgi:hypothetical protein